MRGRFGLVAAALIALAGCDGTPPANNATLENTVTEAPTATVATENVILPPSIRETRTFRCADNSVVYAAILNGDEQINLRATQTGMPNVLRGPKGGPFEGEDGTKASLDGAVMMLTRPGGTAQRCVSG